MSCVSYQLSAFSFQLSDNHKKHYGLADDTAES